MRLLWSALLDAIAPARHWGHGVRDSDSRLAAGGERASDRAAIRRTGPANLGLHPGHLLRSHLLAGIYHVQTTGGRGLTCAGIEPASGAGGILRSTAFQARCAIPKSVCRPAQEGISPAAD